MPTARGWRLTTRWSPSMRQRPNASPRRCARPATGGTVTELDGFTTAVPPPDGPLQPEATRPLDRRDPYAMDAMGLRPGTDSRRSAASSTTSTRNSSCFEGTCTTPERSGRCRRSTSTACGRRRPILDRDGFVSVLSVDIGDFNTPSDHLKDEAGNGKAARDCTADEIAAEVWRQIVTALTSSVANVAEALLPWPAWYAIDRGLIMAGWSRSGCRPSDQKRDSVPGSHRRGLA